MTASVPTKRCTGYSGPAYHHEPHLVPNDPAFIYPTKSKCRDCYRAYATDWRAARDRRDGADRASVRPRGAWGGGTRQAIMDGQAMLEDLVSRARYPSVAALVAEHAVFLHPDTVRQAGEKAMFPVIRDMIRRGQRGVSRDGRPVLLDDNTSPTAAFLWAANRSKGRDVQFNHIWTASDDPDAYTALWNVCATPAFLAKTTDGAGHEDVTSVLRFRAYELYGRHPKGTPVPLEPDGYRDLGWAPHPPPVADLERVIRDRLAASPKSRPAIACREIGWCFSNWQPDSRV